MPNKTSIEWTATVQPDGTIKPGYSSNPIKFRRKSDGRTVHGCVKVSDGCKNCYAETIAKRFEGGAYTVPYMAGLEPFLDEKELRGLLSPKRVPAGSKVFIGDMTDIFGEWVPEWMLDRIAAVMALRGDVTWQLLTKRPERMREYWLDEDVWGRIDVAGRKLHHAECKPCRDADWAAMPRPHFNHVYLPHRAFPNVRLGTSVENQATADERIPLLLDTPAEVRFISYEPALGPVDLTWCAGINALEKDWTGGPGGGSGAPHPLLDWVIVGGESGPGARWFDVSWAERVIQQCQTAGVAVFVKQIGGKPGRPFEAGESVVFRSLKLRSRKGNDMNEWPEYLRVREWPEVSRVL